MSPESVGIIGILILFVLFFTGLPIGLAMLIVGSLGLWFIASPAAGIGVIASTFFTGGSMYSLSVLPLFIIMGAIAFRADISGELYQTGHAWFGDLRGGLAIATIVGCAGFAAVTGSSIASAVTMGNVAFPEMRKYGYDDKLSLGTIAAGGTLGVLIPPSLAFVVYGMVAEQPIGQLLLAGIFPGLLLTLLFIITLYILALINPSRAPQGPKTTFKEKIGSLKGLWATLLLFFIVIGGMYAGIFVPTEAAAIGVVGTFLISRVRKKLDFKGLVSGFLDSAKTTGMIFLMIIGSQIFNVFLARTKLPFELAEIVLGMQTSPYVILTVIVIIYLILGCIMESYSMIVLTVPILFPVVMALGFDPIWYGVIMVLVIEAGLITPPVGLNVYALGSITKNVNLMQIFEGALPFVFAMVVCIVILTLFPQIATFIPYSMLR